MRKKVLKERMSGTPEVIRTKAEVTAIEMQAVVKGKDTADSTWKEVVEVSSVSATGAGFLIPRELKVGTIVAVMLPLAAHLRCYDHAKELYRVFGLVQHCQPLMGDDGGGFHVGVAFVSKHAPESYKENPHQNYKICGMNENGLWKITETRAPFKVRRHLRFWTNVDLYLALVDAQRDSLAGEKTVTENISKSGAAVFSTMDVGIGQRVKFICERYDFSGLAVVCNNQISSDGRQRLHLQFVESSFPVEKLDQSSFKTTNK